MNLFGSLLPKLRRFPGAPSSRWFGFTEKKVAVEKKKQLVRTKKGSSKRSSVGSESPLAILFSKPVYFFAAVYAVVSGVGIFYWPLIKQGYSDLKLKSAQWKAATTIVDRETDDD